MTRDTNQSPAASSSTLWATASKEWVIPAKPKPGRKPKKEAPQPKDEMEVHVDSKGRRVQNRAAQRAFRERKQSQLAELQARVQQFEQGEIERNVALQNISKKLKDENDQLRRENELLKDEIMRLKRENVRDRDEGTSTTTQDSVDPRKRWRDDEHEGLAADLVPLFPNSAFVRKRQRMGTDSPIPMGSPIATLQQQRHHYTASPPSFASSPDSGSVFSPSPYSISVPAITHSRSPSVAVPVHGGMSIAPPRSVPTPTPTPTAPSHMFSPAMALRVASGLQKVFDPQSFSDARSAPVFDGFDSCGLCSENTSCVCRELAMQQYNMQQQGLQQVPVHSTLQVEMTEQKPSIITIPPASEDEFVSKPTSTRKTAQQPRKSPAAGQAESTSSSSILENLPAYQPAVPLRRNSRGNEKRVNTLFEIRLPSPEPPSALPPSSSTRPSARRAASSAASFSLSAKAIQKAASEAVCSGDPSNCAACKDDDFGRAFCAALGDTVCSTSPCATCPTPEKCSSRIQEADTGSMTTNAAAMIPVRPELPRSLTEPSSSISTISPSALLNPPMTPTTLPSPTQTQSHMAAGGSKIPANEAWRQLKSHPNIAFADLTMLADVVARRTKCSGPVVVVHPPLGSLTPERAGARSPATREELGSQLFSEHKDGEDLPVVLVDPHAHFRAQEENRTLRESPPISFSSEADLASTSGQISLVPQEELRQCGRAHLREVDPAGVKDALRLLDARFGRQ